MQELLEQQLVQPELLARPVQILPEERPVLQGQLEPQPVLAQLVQLAVLELQGQQKVLQERLGHQVRLER